MSREPYEPYPVNDLIERCRKAEDKADYLLEEINRTEKQEQRDSRMVEEIVKRVNLNIAEQLHEHWQDNDTPQYERSFGCCKMAA